MFMTQKLYIFTHSSTKTMKTPGSAIGKLQNT